MQQLHKQRLLLTSRKDVTGPADATSAIFYVFDIFGYFPQSIQGADILSTSDKDHSYQVFMPDFFDDKHNIVLGGSWATHPRIAGRKSL